MYLDLFCPAANGTGPVAQSATFNDAFPGPDAFEQLPINLSSDEIRAMVQELLG